MTEDPHDRTIPLYAEQVQVTREDVISDRVRVTTSVEERSILVEDDVERGALHIERVPVDLPVQSAPAPRQEGDTLIVSLVEERLVVEKRLFVVEELRITRTSTIEHVAVPETVRTMRATVERADPAPSTGKETNG